jgi:hypothetical protein
VRPWDATGDACSPVAESTSIAATLGCNNPWPALANRRVTRGHLECGLRTDRKCGWWPAVQYLHPVEGALGVGPLDLADEGQPRR